ncbi:MAG: T6SS effector amidase Tae4 family protein [Pseudomonadota bacterium]
MNKKAGRFWYPLALAILVAPFSIIAPSFAAEQEPSGCYAHFAEWDQTVEKMSRLSNLPGPSVPEGTRGSLTSRYADLQRRHDSFYYGTHQFCEENRQYLSKIEEHNKDAAEQRAQAAEHERERADYMEKCTIVDTEGQLADCNAWAEAINERAAYLNEWSVRIEERKSRLDAWQAQLNDKADNLNADWVQTLAVFMQDVDQALAAAEKIPLDRANALKNVRLIRDAVAQGEKPPFQPLWDYYGYNRPIAEGLVPDENRCAIVLSMTLGLEPRAGEATVEALGNKLHAIAKQIKRHVTMDDKPHTIDAVADAEIAKRYYIKAQQLADRLRDEWGEPLAVEGPQTLEAISGKRGVIFIQNAYRRAGSAGERTGDHIDVWDADHIASDSSTPFDDAEQVWFWEIAEP